MKFEGTPSKVLKELIKYIFKNWNKENLVCIIAQEETKEIRSYSQNRTWYRLFNGISKHLGEHIEKIKMYFLIGCFGKEELILSRTKMEIPLKSRTSNLTKEEGILLIDTLIQFTKIKNIPIEITPREIQSLYDSYKNLDTNKKEKGVEK